MRYKRTIRITSFILWILAILVMSLYLKDVNDWVVRLLMASSISLASVGMYLGGILDGFKAKEQELEKQKHGDAEPRTFTFIDIDERHLSVDAKDIDEARMKLLETLEWELEGEN